MNELTNAVEGGFTFFFFFNTAFCLQDTAPPAFPLLQLIMSQQFNISAFTRYVKGKMLGVNLKL